MGRNIEHKPEQRRFEYTEDHVTSHIDYKLDGTTMVIQHTRVPEALGGRGIAGDLTRAALDTVRRNGWKVIPECTYTQAFLKRHADYQDLLAK